ncbi:hypothetical protein EG328_006761 [Venturia inaequalis]|uniref:Uncharacterized protein n=1 Tax=Venturia inaequalis TaxID=5025 RepID=A0A8H3VCB8_VENIN|nr:hypothetical protein EG328_006761 [Venturia inaequalis]KAE9992062.1 hypothetical protein EG327_010274 [Venturia inaequalis]
MENNHGFHAGDSEEKGAIPANTYSKDYEVIFKTWTVVAILASAYGVSFWIVPTIAVINTGVATQLGDPAASVWYTSLRTICNAIAFVICEASSDLFKCRWFLVGGNILLLIGHIICNVAKNNTTTIAGFAIIGFGAGIAQLAISGYRTIPGRQNLSTAATGAGLLEFPLPALFKALPLGSTALAQVPGSRTSIMVAAGTAVQQSCMHVLRAVALSSLSLGILAMIACICCNDMSEKMNGRIEVFVENDEFADKNVCH